MALFKKKILGTHAEGGGSYHKLHEKGLEATRKIARAFGLDMEPLKDTDGSFKAHPNLLRTSGGSDAVHKAFSLCYSYGIRKMIFSHPTFFPTQVGKGWIESARLDRVAVKSKEDLTVDIVGIKKALKDNKKAAFYIPIPENPSGRVMQEKDLFEIIDSLGNEQVGIFDCVGVPLKYETLMDLPKIIIQYAREKGKKVMVVGSISKLGYVNTKRSAIGKLFSPVVESSTLRTGYLASANVDLSSAGTEVLNPKGSDVINNRFWDKKHFSKLKKEILKFHKTLSGIEEFGYKIASNESHISLIFLPDFIDINIFKDEFKKRKLEFKDSDSLSLKEYNLPGMPRFVRLIAVKNTGKYKKALINIALLSKRKQMSQNRS